MMSGPSMEQDSQGAHWFIPLILIAVCVAVMVGMDGAHGLSFASRGQEIKP